MASLVGPGIASKDLIQPFSLFLKDETYVRNAALDNYANFICALSKSGQEQFLSLYHDFFELVRNDWRERITVAEQLELIIPLYSTEECFQYIVPLVLRCAKDPVAGVRKTVISSVTIWFIKW